MNIAQHVERAAKFFPDKTAILFEGTAWSYGDLNERANRLANALQAIGVQRGDRVSLYLPNIPEFALCYLSAMKVGAVVVSISALFKTDEVSYIVNDSASVAMFTLGDLLVNVARDRCPSLKHIVVCAGDTQGNPTLDDWMSKGARDGKAAEMLPDESVVSTHPAQPVFRKARRSRMAMSSRISIQPFTTQALRRMIAWRFPSR